MKNPYDLDELEPDELDRWAHHARGRDRKRQRRRPEPTPAAPERGPTRAATVLEANRRSVRVQLAPDEEPQEVVLGGHLHGGQLAVGDTVICRLTEPPVVVRVAPRRTALTRRSPHRPHPVVALANVDVVAIVSAATDPPFRPGLVDRYLVAIAAAGATPVVVVNKADDDPAAADALLEEWRALGIPTVACSARTGLGLAALREALGAGVSAFVGHSGVGKSSLLQALTGEDAAAGALADHGRGRHTTSSARLYALPGGGSLIDTPGVRSFAPDDPAPGDLAAAFPDVVDAAARCAFSGCTHASERDCAVVDAIDAGRLSAGRLERWRRLADDG